jgi:hypothetical protein
MSSTAVPYVSVVSPAVRLEVLFEELAELAGQRNAIDGRIVQIVAEIDREQLWGATGARSVAALVAWKTGASPGNAKTLTAVARRLDAFPDGGGSSIVAQTVSEQAVETTPGWGSQWNSVVQPLIHGPNTPDRSRGRAGAGSRYERCIRIAPAGAQEQRPLEPGTVRSAMAKTLK